MQPVNFRFSEYDMKPAAQVCLKLAVIPGVVVGISALAVLSVLEFVISKLKQ